MIDPDVKLGHNVKIFDRNLVNLFGCEIGDDTFIGPFVEITRDVVIGKHCKVESHVFICSGVTIEDDVFIGHGAVFTNDLYPRTDRNVEYIRTFVKKGASIGSNSTIVPGVTISENSVVGSGSVVTKDVPPLSIAAGNPASILKRFNNLAEFKAYIDLRQKARKR